MYNIKIDGVKNEDEIIITTIIDRLLNNPPFDKIKDLIENIFITENYQDCIEKISKKGYSQKKHASEAMAITLPKIDEEVFKVQIIIDSELYTICGEVAFTFYFMHELCHVEDYNILIKIFNLKELFKEISNKKEIIRDFSKSIWFEYSANRTCLDLYGDRFDKPDFFLWYTDTLESLLESTPANLRILIDRFRKYELDIDNFLLSAGPYYREILQLMAYITAFEDSKLKIMPDLTAIISKTEGYKIFLSNNWNNVSAKLLEMYKLRSKLIVEDFDKLDEEVEKVLIDFGIKITDTKEGPYFDILTI